MSPIVIALAFLLGCVDIAREWIAALAVDVREGIEAWLRVRSAVEAGALNEEEVAFFRSIGVEVVSHG